MGKAETRSAALVNPQRRWNKELSGGPDHREQRQRV